MLLGLDRMLGGRPWGIVLARGCRWLRGGWSNHVVPMLSEIRRHRYSAERWRFRSQPPLWWGLPSYSLISSPKSLVKSHRLTLWSLLHQEPRARRATAANHDPKLDQNRGYLASSINQNQHPFWRTSSQRSRCNKMVLRNQWQSCTRRRSWATKKPVSKRLQASSSRCVPLKLK